MPHSCPTIYKPCHRSSWCFFSLSLESTHQLTTTTTQHMVSVSKRVLLSISIVFTFAGFLFVCIATAGSSSNYKPITNVYLGDAGISHINVSKVLPVLSPVLDVLGSAILAPGANKDLIFSSLKNMSHTAVLAPFLTLLINCENTTTALNAVMNLTPLIMTINNNNTQLELNGFNQLLSTSKNSNDTVDYLQTLLKQVNDFNSTQMISLENTAFSLLTDSSHPANTSASLVALSNLTLAEMAPLLPAFELLQKSNNVTATFEALSTLMNTSIPNTLAISLFSTLATAINSNTDLAAVFDKMSATIPKSLASSASALENILVNSKDENSTLSTLNNIMQANLTSSTTAKNILATLTNLVDNASNKSLILNSLTGLVSAVGNQNVTSELTTLNNILSISNDQSANVKTLQSLQNVITTDTSNNKYIPYLFDILQTSKDPAASFSSLLNVTTFASQNIAEFTPLLGVLKNATSSPIPTDKQLYDLTESVLQYLQIPAAFRLSIFTLCQVDHNNDIIKCSNSHAVQNLDFRAIIYDALIKSDLQPYIKTLDIGADDLQLQGHLLKKEHMYVPAIKAVLACNIIYIVSSFSIMCYFIYMFIRHHEFALSHRGWFILMALSLFCPLFSGISATIVAVITTVIKSGTYKDRYNVVYTSGSAYSGLSWCAFAISFVTSMIVGVMWLNHWKGAHDGHLPFPEHKHESTIVEVNHDISSSASSKASKNEINAIEEKV